MKNTLLSVKKHEGKVRLHIEWPAEGNDADLMRAHDWDIPVVHALALAAGIVSEVVASLRLPPSTRQKGAETSQPATTETASAIDAPPGVSAVDSDVATSACEPGDLRVASTGDETNRTR